MTFRDEERPVNDISLASDPGRVEVDLMTLTRENLRSIGKNGIGFNSAQLTLLGITRAQKGWLTGLIGKEIDDDTWKTLQYLKGAKPNEQQKIVPNRAPVWKNTFAAAKRITYTPS